MLAVAGVGATFASMQCLAADVSFVGPGPSWHDGANWSDGNVPSNGGDVYFIQHSLTATYSTGSSSVASAVIADDLTGLLNVTGGQHHRDLAAETPLQSGAASTLIRHFTAVAS